MVSHSLFLVSGWQLICRLRGILLYLLNLLEILLIYSYGASTCILCKLLSLTLLAPVLYLFTTKLVSVKSWQIQLCFLQMCICLHFERDNDSPDKLQKLLMSWNRRFRYIDGFFCTLG